MHKIFFIFSLIIFSVSLFAQTPVVSKKLSKRDIIIIKIKQVVEAGQIQDFLRKCVSKIDKGKPDGTRLTPIEYSAFCFKIERWIKYRWFIADTGLSKKWLRKVHELMLYMTKTKSYLESAKFSGNTKNKKYPQAVKYFDVAYKRFVKLVKKPVMVSGKVRRKAKVQRVLWEKAMRKKYKIKGKIQEEF